MCLSIWSRIKMFKHTALSYEICLFWTVWKFPYEKCLMFHDRILMFVRCFNASMHMETSRKHENVLMGCWMGLLKMFNGLLPTVDTYTLYLWISISSVQWNHNLNTNISFFINGNKMQPHLQTQISVQLKP